MLLQSCCAAGLIYLKCKFHLANKMTTCKSVTHLPEVTKCTSIWLKMCANFKKKRLSRVCSHSSGSVRLQSSSERNQNANYLISYILYCQEHWTIKRWAWKYYIYLCEDGISKKVVRLSHLWNCIISLGEVKRYQKYSPYFSWTIMHKVCLKSSVFSQFFSTVTTLVFA